MPDIDVLSALQDWYRRNCDGEWEHHYGIKIETCDNPGWWIKIDLHGTDLSSASFVRVAENVDGDGCSQSPTWLCCQVKDEVWHGACDENQLQRVLEIFVVWMKAHNL